MSPTRARPGKAPPRRRVTLHDGGYYLRDGNDAASGRPSLGATLCRGVYAAVAIALGYVLFFMLTSSVFDIANVQVTGTRFADSAAIASTARVSGVNIFQVNSQTVTTAVLALGVPARASVQVVLPGTVAIAVDEPPASFVWQAGASSYAVSADGVVLGPSTASALPTVLDPAGQALAIGNSVNPAVLHEAAYVLAVLPTAAGFQLTSVSFDRQHGISLRSPDGLTIILGDDTSLQDKLADLAPLRKIAGANPATTTVDLSVAGHPIIRASPGQSPPT